MIFFTQTLPGGPIRIALAPGPDPVLAALPSHYGRPVAVLATLPGGAAELAAVYARFGSLRYGGTKQFRPGAELMAFIRSRSARTDT